jgi:hypothetical protein
MNMYNEEFLQKRGQALPGQVLQELRKQDRISLVDKQEKGITSLVLEGEIVR